MANASQALLVASFCAWSATGLADDVENAVLWGSYTNSSVSESETLIDHAVGKATHDLSLLVRGIARRRLKEVNPPYAHIALSQHAGEIATDFDGRRYVADEGGKVRKNVAPDGATVYVTFRLQGRTLHGLYTAKDGVKAIDFSLDPDGHTLEVRVKVSSPKLPDPLTYDLTYHVGS